MLFRSRTRDSFGAAGVGNARVRSARGARRGEKRATGGQTRAITRCAKNTAGIDFEAGTHPPPRRRREWATCPCCWYTRIRRRSLRRGTPWRARCGSARAGCRRSFPVASGRRDARVAVPGLERTLATSTQRAAGESGACVEWRGLGYFFSRKVKKIRMSHRFAPFFLGFNLERIR